VSGFRVTLQDLGEQAAERRLSIWRTFAAFMIAISGVAMNVARGC